MPERDYEDLNYRERLAYWRAAKEQVELQIATGDLTPGDNRFDWLLLQVANDYLRPIYHPLKWWEWIRWLGYQAPRNKFEEWYGYLRYRVSGVPRSASHPRPSGKPFYIRTTCEVCGLPLVLSDILDNKPLSHVWHDSWTCPRGWLASQEARQAGEFVSFEERRAWEEANPCYGIWLDHPGMDEGIEDAV